MLNRMARMSTQIPGNLFVKIALYSFIFRIFLPPFGMIAIPEASI
jgi:hypothetical protein